MRPTRVLLFANTDWYLYNFRRPLIQALVGQGYEVLLVSPEGPYGPQLERDGARWFALPMQRRSLNPARELALVAWLVRFVRRQQVDLIHNFTIKCAVYGAAAARMVGVKACVNAVAGLGYVFTSGDLQARMLRPLVRQLMHLTLNAPRSRLILQNPDDVAEFERARIVDVQRIRLIRGSGVDCSRFVPATPASRAAGAALRVVLPARLLWDKGIAEFVEASRLLQQQGRRNVFLLAGNQDPGNPAAIPEGRIAGWVDEGLIQWLGHVDDMPALFRSVDVVALPSYREGLPKGLIEAAACGLPLVTTDAPGCREVVQHDRTGLIVPVGDAQSLALAIARLQDDPVLCARLGKEARDQALAEFDHRLVVSRTLDVYRELLGGVAT